VLAARPLIRLRHEYPELAVDLDTWLVTAWRGTPVSNEHPRSAWVAPDDLPRWKLLAADAPIVNALRLPEHCIFTPPALDPQRLLGRVSEMPPGLVRLRLPAVADPEYAEWVHELAPVILEGGHQLVVDRDPTLVQRFGADGFHARSEILKGLSARPVAADKWFGASCHDAHDLARARELGADYAVLGPVKPTPTHPGAQALGWESFAKLAIGAGLPVYAIGGVGPADLEMAWRNGAQGVAGIRAYWRD
jgi:8-oxo-dGTP diphosphatase